MTFVYEMPEFKQNKIKLSVERKCRCLPLQQWVNHILVEVVLVDDHAHNILVAPLSLPSATQI